MVWTLHTRPWYIRAGADVDARLEALRRAGVGADALSDACRHIRRLADALRMPFRTAAAAMLYVHVYYVRNAPVDEADKGDGSGAASGPAVTAADSSLPEPRDMALTALFAAGKAEETHKKLVPLLQTAAYLALHPDVPPASVLAHAEAVAALRVDEFHARAVTRRELALLDAVEYTFCVPPLAEAFACVLAAVEESRRPPGRGRRASRPAGRRAPGPPSLIRRSAVSGALFACMVACCSSARLLLCYAPGVLALGAAVVAGVGHVLPRDVVAHRDVQEVASLLRSMR